MTIWVRLANVIVTIGTWQLDIIYGINQRSKLNVEPVKLDKKL